MSLDEVTDLTKGIVGDPDWIRRWKVGESFWQGDTPDRYLLENGPTFFGGTQKRIFLPLCGKSMDLLWLYENGHEVVGVELAQQPVTDLFDENNFQHTVEHLQDGGEVYKSNDGRFTIFRANLFHLPVEKYGRFDAVWDKQSFTAINLEDHKRYRDLMYATMKPDAVYYMKTLEYDGAVWPGPPHSISEAVLIDTFGDACKIEKLEEMESGKLYTSGLKTEEKREMTVDVEAKSSNSMTETTSLTDTATKTDEQENSGFTAKENNSSNEQKDISNEPSKVEETPKPFNVAQAAIITSRFRFHRWYKMQLK